MGKRNRPKSLRQLIEETRRIVKSQGYRVVTVPADEAAGEPSFCYTLGLQENYSHPEIIMFGADPSLVLMLATDVKAGEFQLTAGTFSDTVFKGLPAAVLAVLPGQ